MTAGGDDKAAVIWLRYIELYPQRLSAEAIRANASTRWSFDMNDAMGELLLTKNAAKALQLTASFGAEKAPPLWTSPPFCATFADPFLEDSGLDGQPASRLSQQVLALALKTLGEELASTGDGHFLRHGTHKLSPNQLTALELVRQVFCCDSHTDKVFKLYQELVELFLEAPDPSDGFEHLPAVVEAVTKAIAAFLARVAKRESPCYLLLPAGWHSKPGKAWHFVALIIEPEVDADADACWPPASYRLTVCNPGGEGMKWHGSSAALPPKVKHRSALTLNGIRAERLKDEGFISMLYGMTGFISQRNEGKCKAFMFYETLLPWLLEQPLRVAAAQKSSEAVYGWRTPQYSNCDAFRSLLEGVKYMLLRGDPLVPENGGKEKRLSAKQVKMVSFALRSTMMSLAQKDLEVVRAVTAYDRALIGIATRQLAFSAVKGHDAGYLQPAELLRVHSRIEGVWEAVAHKPQLAPGSNSLISLNNMELGRLSATLFSHCDRLVWRDVRGKEGPMRQMPKQLPVDLLCLERRPRVATPADIIDVMRQTEVLCLQLSSLKQSESVRHASFLKIALLQRVFTHIVPVPLPKTLAASSRVHPWAFASPLTHAEQLDALLLVARLTQHFAAAAFSTLATKAFDAPKVVVLGVLVAISDYLLRQKASDHISTITEVLLGIESAPDLQQGDEGELAQKAAHDAKHAGQRSPQYGIGADLFLKQCETYEITVPELNVARSGVYNYFSSQHIHPQCQVISLAASS